MIPLVAFDAMVAPEFFTQELAMIIGILFMGFLWTSIRLRSLFGFFGLMLMTVTLMSTFFMNLQLIWFWVTVIVESFVLTLAMMEYTRVRARTNN